MTALGSRGQKVWGKKKVKKGVGCGIAIGFLCLDLPPVQDTRPRGNWPRCKLKADDSNSAAPPAVHFVLPHGCQHPPVGMQIPDEG